MHQLQRIHDYVVPVLLLLLSWALQAGFMALQRAGQQAPVAPGSNSGWATQPFILEKALAHW